MQVGASENTVIIQPALQLGSERVDMSPHTHEQRTFCALLLSACLGVACAEPEARDVDFNERSAGLVEPADRFDWSGLYLLALSTVLAPEEPVLFGVHSEVSSDLALVSLHVQPLTTDADSDPRSPLGDPFSLNDIPYSEDGTFEVDLGESPFSAERIRLPARISLRRCS
jgi:hypothetical protein